MYCKARQRMQEMQRTFLAEMQRNARMQEKQQINELVAAQHGPKMQELIDKSRQ